MKFSAVKILAGWWVLALLFGCSPVSDSERAYLEQRKAERTKEEALANTLENGVEDSEIIDMVKDSSSPREGMKTSEWTEDMVSRYPGDVMFERWNAVRQGQEKYRVEFTCTVMGENNMISKQGWFWTVNQVLKLISPPQEISKEDKERQRSRYQREPTPQVAPLLNLE